MLEASYDLCKNVRAEPNRGNDMKLAKSLCLIAMCVGVPAHAGPVQWAGNGNYYEYVPSSANWTKANALAQSRIHNGIGGQLATITSEEENSFLYGLFQAHNSDGSSNAWVGGFRDENSGGSDHSTGWRWVTGEEFTYANWYPGEPNNQGGDEDFLQVYNYEGGGWNDCSNVACGNKVGYFVEYNLNGPYFWEENGNYYEFVQSDVNWSDANEIAKSKTYNGKQGHLATITSMEENDFLLQVFLKQNLEALANAWIGGYQEGDDWKWVTGELFEFANWYPGEPNNLGGDEDFLQIYNYDGGRWNDCSNIVCGNKAGFFIEYSLGDLSVPEPSATLSMVFASILLAGATIARTRFRS